MGNPQEAAVPSSLEFLIPAQRITTHRLLTPGGGAALAPQGPTRLAQYLLAKNGWPFYSLKTLSSES
jgi:hypothetical protein